MKKKYRKPKGSCKYKRCVAPRVIGKYCEKHHNVVSGITEVKYTEVNLTEPIEEVRSFWGWLIDIFR